MDNLYIKLKKVNEDLHIYHIYDREFLKYGIKHDIMPYQLYLDYLENKTEIPNEGNYYLAHDEDLQKVSCVNDIHDVFGYTKLQFGYVNGHNTKLNALEYHKSSEINISLTPLTLILADQSDLIDNDLDVHKVKIFYVPARTVIELHPLTLHFSPCKVIDEGFKCGVILPYGTNMDFVKAKNLNVKENQLLFKTNKWLIAHAEHKKFIELGAYEGIKGKNIEIKY